MLKLKPSISLLKTKFICRTSLVALICLIFLLAPAHATENPNLDNPRDLYNKIVATLHSGNDIAGEELQLLQKFFRFFTSVLAEKLLNADAATRLRFEPVKRLINSTLTAENTSLGPTDDHYQTIKAIFAEISNSPVLAITMEESIRHPDRSHLAIIKANKGPGATYRLKETVQFGITAAQDSFVQVFFLSTPRDDKKGAFLQPLLFQPAPGRKSVALREGDTLILGEDNSFIIEPPYGTDIILVLATRKKLDTGSNTRSYPVPYPLNFETLFATIYGKQKADTLSLHSCFIVSKTLE